MSTQGELVEEEEGGALDAVVEWFDNRRWLLYFLVVEFILWSIAIALEVISDDTVENPNNDLTIIPGIIAAWAVFVAILVGIVLTVSLSLTAYSRYKDARA